MLDVDFGEPQDDLVICSMIGSLEDKLLKWQRVAKGPIERTPAEQPPASKDGTETIAELDLSDPCLLSCLGIHGLAVFTTPNDFRCNACSGFVPSSSRACGAVGATAMCVPPAS